MTETIENVEITESQKTYLESQHKTGLIFGLGLVLFYIANLTYITGHINPPVIFFGILIYRGLGRRMSASNILKDPRGTNKGLYLGCLWNFTWKIFVYFFIIPVAIGYLIAPKTADYELGTGIGLLFGQFLIGFIFSADRSYWVIKKFRKKAYTSF